MEGSLGHFQRAARVGELLQLSLDEWQSLGGPEGEAFRGGGFEVASLRVHDLACRLGSFLKDAMQSILGGNQSAASLGQLLQLALDQRQGLGSP